MIGEDGQRTERKEGKAVHFDSPIGESKYEGQFNYTIKLIVLIVASS